MNYLNFENFLVNLSFFLLFASMLYYWIQLIFFSNIFNGDKFFFIGLNKKTNSSAKSNSSVDQLFSLEQNLLSKEEKEKYLTKNTGHNVKQIQDANQKPLLNKKFFLKNNNLKEKKGPNIHYGQLIVFLANLTMLVFLLDRWFESGHFPLSNLYESLIFLSWCLTSINLWIEKIQPSDFILFFSSLKKLNFHFNWNKISNIQFLNSQNEIFINNQNLILQTDFKTATKFNNQQKTFPKNKNNYIFGGIITPIALLINAFASFTLPPELRESTPLVPALQSNWLIMHVTVIMLSYAALLTGCLFSFVFLIFNIFFSGEQKYIQNQDYQNNLTETNKLTEAKKQQNSISSFPDILDNLSYRTIGIGFLLLTIGIFSGAVWANEAWGSYWSWDPKETWALITWFIFALYLHARLQLKWSRKHVAIIACTGFVIVWICYLGVNLLGQGLHSYGFLKQ